MNPYQGEDFFGFLFLLCKRFFLLCFGKIPLSTLASDEIQVGVLVGIAASCALIGSFLVLKKMTMLANSLSHTILLGIVMSVLIVRGSLEGMEHLTLTHLFIAAVLSSLFTAWLTQWLTHVMRLQEDASIGLVFTTLFALSVVLVTAFTRNTHLGTEAIMGNCDALHLHDFKLVSILLIVDFLVVFLLFKEFVLATFDVKLTRALGFSPKMIHYVLMFLTAGTVVASFRAVGVLLVLAFIVGPVLTAQLLTKRLKSIIFLSLLIGCFASIVGVALSRHLLSVYQMPLSTGGLVVCMLGIFYLFVLALRSFRRYA